MVGLAENKATQPSLAGAWAELGNFDDLNREIYQPSGAGGTRSPPAKSKDDLSNELNFRNKYY